MVEVPRHLNLALDHGVRPAEISETITHLAFYSGWGNALSAVAKSGDGQCPDRHGASGPDPVSPEPRDGRRLTQAQAAEALTHLAFYVGWPNVFSALPVARTSSKSAPAGSDDLPDSVSTVHRISTPKEGAPPMPTWMPEELSKIAASEELDIASVRHDGQLGHPVTIWVVRVGDDLYVRSWKGDAGAWFRATRAHQAGHIEAGGVGKDVTYVAETRDDVNDRIDAAYRAKYRRHGGRYVDPMVAPTARAATIKLVPRSTTS